MDVSRAKACTGKLLLLPAGVLAGILILEILLRIVGISDPRFYVIDQVTGIALRPNAEGWYRKEGEAYVRINSAGLRDMEHSKAKPANTLRIAVLGDSFTEAKQVPVEETFWAVMEKELEGCEALDGRVVEVLNFGVNGYGTAQELLTLRHRAWEYDPDIVVVAFLTGNDVSDNSRTLRQDPMRPYFRLENGELVLDASFAESAGFRTRQTWLGQLWYRLVVHSRVLQVASNAKNARRASRVATQGQGSAVDGTFAEPGVDLATYSEPSDPVWEEAWRVTEELIALMAKEVMDRGAGFVVVTLSNPIQVHPEPATRETSRASLGVDDLFYPDLRIKALGEREGFPVLNLAQPLQAYAEEHQVFLHGFENAALGKGHWNSEGHRLAGCMIAQMVCADFTDGD